MELGSAYSAAESSLPKAGNRWGPQPRNWPLSFYSGTPPSNDLPADLIRAPTSGEWAAVGLQKKADSPCFFGSTPSPSTAAPSSASPANAMQID